MVERVEPTAVPPVIVDPIPLAPVAVVVPPGAVTGTVVAVQGQNVAIPAGYAAGAEWQHARHVHDDRRARGRFFAAEREE